jgi:hypothetical protein
MYVKYYSVTGFWGKISALPENTGCTILKKGITLYVLLTECDLSVRVRTFIILGK